MTIKISSRFRDYNIYIGKNILEKTGEIFKATAPSAKAFIITDSNVGSLYLKKVYESLLKYGIQTFSISIPAGEGSKNFKTVQMLTDAMFNSKITRSDAVIALGGGVVGDISGFAASIYMRGIKFIQIPSSLLAQVDSSIGGKTGIDTSHGKNTIGAFYPPHAVITDTEVLKTLPETEFACGMAEIIKSAAIKDESFFNRLESGCETEDMIKSSLLIKKALVEEDELEQGSRRLLNFGHTFGHAIETYYGYNGSLLHGEAVAVGMALITEKCVKNNICDKSTYDRLINVIRKYKLPTEIEYDCETVSKHIKMDKKAESDGLNFVVLKKPGHAEVLKIGKDDLQEWLY